MNRILNAILICLLILTSCNAPWNILSTKSPEEKREARAIKHLDKARRLDPDLFNTTTDTKIKWIDSIRLQTKDSIIIKERINITGRTEIICDTILGKPKPFYQEVNTGLVKLRMWIDTSGKFYYTLDQDSIKQRFKELESVKATVKDSTTTTTITVPKIVYRLSWLRVLLVLAIGTGIGFLLQFLLRAFSGQFTWLTSLVSKLRQAFKKTPGK